MPLVNSKTVGINATRAEIKRIDALVEHYKKNSELFVTFFEQVKALFYNSKALVDCVHSMRGRVKEPSSLKDKLFRKLEDRKSEGKPFDITTANLFEEITDLVGFRILHLHTTEFESINRIVLSLLAQENWVLTEGPEARTWDDEYRDYFRAIKVKTRTSSQTMYTSVHYLFKANKQQEFMCELQVRTLAEELWGEVDHRINYPHKVDSVACQEQIKALARVTSSCTRLVDSILKSYEDSKRASRKSKS